MPEFVVLSSGSVAAVLSVFPSGRLLVRVVSRGTKAHHKVGDCLVWHPLSQ